MSLKTRSSSVIEWPEFSCESAEMVVEKYLGMLCLTPMIPEGGVARYRVNGKLVHVIYLRNNFPGEIRTDRFYETFVHELIHIFHFVQNLPIDEDKVEAECTRFYSINRDFVIELYESVAKSHKYLVWDPPMGSLLTSGDRLRLIKQKIKESKGRS